MKQEQARTLKRSLSLNQAVFFGLAIMAPVTFFVIYGVAIQSTQGMLPTAYAIALVMMLFTAYSYSQLVKAFPSAGSSYTFTQKAMNPHLGFLVGWTILIDYILSPMISALFFGIMMSAYFPAVPQAIWILLFIAIITVVNILGIKIAARFNAFVLLLQFLIFALFFGFSLKRLLAGDGAGTLFSVLPFYDPNVDISAIFTTIPLLCFTFLGFDAVTSLSEETNQPQKTLPKAIYLIAISAVSLYIVAAYFAQLVHPDFNSFSDPEAAHIDLFMEIAGNFVTSLVLAMIIPAGFASAISSGAATSRIMYAMGRENVLPQKIFGYLSAKYRTPVYNLLMIGCVALCSLFFDVMTATALINFGALFAFTFINIAVICHYFVRQRQRSAKGVLLYLLLPSIGAVITASLLLMLNAYSLILGGVWLGIGGIYLLFLTKMFTQAPPAFQFVEEPQEPERLHAT